MKTLRRAECVRGQAAPQERADFGLATFSRCFRSCHGDPIILSSAQTEGIFNDSGRVTATHESWETPAHHTNFALRTARARFALVCTVGFRTATGLGENTVRVHLARNLLCTTKS